MSTTRPRLTITLDPRFFETISRLASLTGKTKSGLITDYLSAIHDPLMRTVALLEAAAEAPEQVRRGLRDAAEGLERDLSASVAGSLVQFDMLMDVASSESSDPPLVTRGSGLQRSRKNKGLRSQAKGTEKG